MGRTKTVKPPTPIAPPPPVEEVDAEFVAPTMRQLAARRARRGAYITGAERKLGGKPRASGKEASAIADKTVRELDPMKGFTAPTRRKGTGGRGGTEGERTRDFNLRKLTAEAEFIQKQADVAGAPELKTLEEVNPNLTAEINKSRSGGRREKLIDKRENIYNRYLTDYIAQSQGRIKRGYRTTQLRNLGLM